MNQEKFILEINKKEQIRCLKKISKKIVRSIFIFEETIKNPQQYNYKEYVKNILIFIQSADKFFDGQLVDVKVGLSGVIDNDFDKQQYKAIVFECKNYIDYLLSKIEEGEEI